MLPANHIYCCMTMCRSRARCCTSATLTAIAGHQRGVRLFEEEAGFRAGPPSNLNEVDLREWR